MGGIAGLELSLEGLASIGRGAQHEICTSRYVECQETEPRNLEGLWERGSPTGLPSQASIKAS